MAITSTTITSAIGTTDTTFAVGSTTNITAPNFTTGVGITYLFAETEAMLVIGVPVSGVVTVQRGVAGTPVSAHGASCPVAIGGPADFGPIVPSIKAQQDPTPEGAMYGMGAPVASAATIVASGPLFHVTGTTAINIITPPPGMVEGGINILFEGACTWTSSNVTNGICSTGTASTANSMVTFWLDASTQRWYPSRVS